MPVIDLLFGGARQRVLARLLLEPDSSFHLRELARLTDCHAGTLGRELDRLVESGLILRSEQGNQVRHQANRDHPLFDELASIFRKTHGVAAVLREALGPLVDQIKFALLFGSMAKGSHSSGSDIDLLVIGEVSYAELLQALYAAQQSLGREINPVLYDQSEFHARVRNGDTFTRNLLAESNVLLIGGKDDLAEFAEHQSTAGAHD